ncbi:hypothetical protein MHB65_18095 [Lysinibacillus sp. FSL K6-0075]|uniref:hypothetical protein n=1 Tax=Lysinibacillus sp. FSL K6-0075 TaxID=2921415 RepID=UPI0031588C13
MKQEQLNAIKERVAKATLGPWKVRNDNEGTEYFPFWVVSKLGLDSGEWFAELHVGDISDAQFIANAREDVPALIAEVERLREALKFYAEETKYERVELCDGDKEIYIERDGGEIARQALGGEPDVERKQNHHT